MAQSHSHIYAIKAVQLFERRGRRSTEYWPSRAARLASGLMQCKPFAEAKDRKACANQPKQCYTIRVIQSLIQVFQPYKERRHAFKRFRAATDAP